MKFQRILRLALVLAFGGPLVCWASPVSTCFTFQGRLRNNNGTPINSPQDISVTLYPQATGGSPVGNPSVNQSNCVPVVNGLFTLTLCFGDPSSYRCEARWLEIAVRPCGSSTFQVLTQRMELLSTPNAIQSLVACTVASNGVSAASIPNGTITSNKIASEQVVKSLNGLRDHVRLVAGNNVTITPNGQNLEVAAQGVPDIWRLNGANAYYNNGRVGIGTDTPASSSKLHAVATTGNGVQGNSTDPIASGVYGENTGNGNGVAGRSLGTGTAVYGDNPGGAGWAGYFNGKLGAAGNVGIGTANPLASLHVLSARNTVGDNTATFSNPPLGPNLSHIHYGSSGDWYIRSARGNGKVVLQDSGGNVGIGTPSPANKLHVDLNSAAFTGLGIDDSYGLLRLGGLDESYYLRARGKSAIAPFDYFTEFIVRGDGRVGIGTDSPKAALHVNRGGPELQGTALSSTLVASSGLVPLLFGNDIALASFGALAEGNNVSLGLRARRAVLETTGWTSTAIGLTFDVDNTVQAGAGIWLGADGNIGIGTPSPTSKLHVAMPGGGTPVTAMQLEVGTFGTVANSLASTFLTARDVGSGQMQFAIRGDGHTYAGGGIGLPGNFGPNGTFAAHGNHISFGHPGVSEDFIGYRDNTFFFKDSPGGGDTCDPTVEVAVLRITGGCDLAEPFEMSHADIPKGAVVVIDEEHPGHLKMSESAYDSRVAGIVSGANGIQAGITLHQEGLIDGGQNVALSGRVYVQADASEHPIKPGDLLTTSDTPGHAMKVTDHARSQGTILGKAMTGLKGGKGMAAIPHYRLPTA